MTQRGHNESAVRLAALAGDAQVALDKVARGEADAIEGWLAYGAALNEGRALFPGDTEFGQWVSENSLRQVGGAEIHDHERASAMWAAANSGQFEEARAAGNARTVRGIHAKWKEIEAQREADAKREAAKIRAQEARAKAEEAAQVETAARREAETATDDSERLAAQERAAAAVEAREAAVADAEDAESAAAPETPPSKYRRGLSSLTREGLEDEIAGLREENEELRARVKDQRGQIADLKARVKDFTGDSAETIRRLTKAVEHQRSQAFQANEKFAASQRQVHALKKSLAEAERQNQVVVL